jgi:hypothetical protein
MQCVSHYRDAFETAAWQLYLRECSLRTAREEVAFLESIGGATKEELDRIRQRVVNGEPVQFDDALVNHNAHLLNIMQPKTEHNEVSVMTHQHDTNNVTVSLKSVLTDIVDSDTAINTLCRRVRPMLDHHGIATFKKHQAVHVLRADAPRIRELGFAVA